MKKFLIIALIGLLGLNGYLLNKLDSLTTRFEKINNTIENLSKINNQNKELRDVNNLIFQSNFKDDLVLNHFNLTVSIIVGFFTILIGFGVYLSFKRIDEDIKNLKEDKSKIKETSKEVKELLNVTTSLKEDLQKEKLKVKLYFLQIKQKNRLDAFDKLNHLQSKITDALQIALSELTIIHFYTSNNIRKDHNIYEEYTLKNKLNSLLYTLKAEQNPIKIERRYIQHGLKDLEDNFPIVQDTRMKKILEKFKKQLFENIEIVD